MDIEVIAKTPFFSYHGSADPVFPIENAKTTYWYLKNKIYSKDFAENAVFHDEYGLAHSMSPTEISTLKDWLAKRFRGIERSRREKMGLVSKAHIELWESEHIKFYGNVLK